MNSARIKKNGGEPRKINDKIIRRTPKGQPLNKELNIN